MNRDAPFSWCLGLAARTLYRGGIVACPTEGVFGLSCNPFDAQAVYRLLALKRRPVEKGLILVAGSVDHLRPFIGGLPRKLLAPALASWPGPATWLVPANAAVPDWVRGDHDTVALRVTAHRPMADLCRHFGGALVSTSANRAGREPALSVHQVRAALGESVDMVVPGPLGGLDGPTPIRRLVDGGATRIR